MLKLFAGRKMLLIPAIGLLLGSCAQTTAISGASSACAVWPYVSWSDKDTDKTIADAKMNNARRDGWCKDGR
jgi:hypothetical protein